MRFVTFRLACFVCGLSVATFTGCSTVTVKQPAGDKAAKLDPEIWEGTWRGPDNFRGVSSIKDPVKGLIEFRSLDPKEKKDTVTLTIRELKDRLVATASGKSGEESAAFFRIAATKDHVAVFTPRLELFKEAVVSGKVAGEARKTGGVPGEKPKPAASDSVVLNQFGAAEVEQMPLAAKGSVAECFDADPDMVLVREKEPKGESKKARGKK